MTDGEANYGACPTPNSPGVCSNNTSPYRTSPCGQAVTSATRPPRRRASGSSASPTTPRVQGAWAGSPPAPAAAAPRAPRRPESVRVPGVASDHRRRRREGDCRSSDPTTPGSTQSPDPGSLTTLFKSIAAELTGADCSTTTPSSQRVVAGQRLTVETESRRGKERPIPRLTSPREGSRHRSRDGCMRVRDRPRKRRPYQGNRPRVVANTRGGAPGAPPQDDLRARAGAHCGARAGRRRAGRVVRRSRCPHRALRRAGARGGARRRRGGRRRVR